VPDQTPTTLWRPDRAAAETPWPVPPLLVAMWRGARFLCPACGETHAFRGYLKVVPECTNCHAPLGEFRSDDAPPYFTIFIVGHLLVPVMYWVETAYRPPLWVHAAIFLPLALVMTLGLLRPVKGATLGLMLKLGMVKSGGT
jgi:uncharacterized protein (DUF983 family)